MHIIAMIGNDNTTSTVGQRSITARYALDSASSMCISLLQYLPNGIIESGQVAGLLIKLDLQKHLKL